MFGLLKQKALGKNLVYANGKYIMITGDVNQDGTDDLTDIVNVYNDANNFFGGYISTDVNGDNFTDLFDLLLTFNNSNKFVRAVRP